MRGDYICLRDRWNRKRFSSSPEVGDERRRSDRLDLRDDRRQLAGAERVIEGVEPERPSHQLRPARARRRGIRRRPRGTGRGPTPAGTACGTAGSGPIAVPTLEPMRQRREPDPRTRARYAAMNDVVLAGHEHGSMPASRAFTIPTSARFDDGILRSGTHESLRNVARGNTGAKPRKQ